MSPASNPLVSIIVPCYNQGDYVQETLTSIKAQTYSNWECIVVNDGSTDNSLDLIKNFIEDDKRFSCIDQRNKGLATSRNEAVNMASGTYILPIDADDKITPNCLSEFVKVFESQLNVTLVYSKVQLFGTLNELWDLPAYSYRKLLMDNMIVATALYRKSDFVKLGGYDSNFKSGHEDWDFWIRLLQNNAQVVMLQEALFWYRRKDQSMIEGILASDEKLYNQYRYITKKHQEIYSEHFESPLVLHHELQKSLKRELQGFKKPIKSLIEIIRTKLKHR